MADNCRSIVCDTVMTYHMVSKTAKYQQLPTGNIRQSAIFKNRMEQGLGCIHSCPCSHPCNAYPANATMTAVTLCLLPCPWLSRLCQAVTRTCSAVWWLSVCVWGCLAGVMLSAKYCRRPIAAWHLALRSSSFRGLPSLPGVVGCLRPLPWLG